MTLFNKTHISLKIIYSILSRRRVPLAVGWNITYNCNLRCRYCNNWKKHVKKELETEKVMFYLEELSSLGIKFIDFSGGEPLLREDLEEIIDSCRRKGIYVSLSSNGTLVKEKISLVKKINKINLSLDGPPEINDKLRGKGVYNRVIDAIRVCKREKIKTSITTVISKYNISSIPYILDIAKKYKVGVHFQPATRSFSGDCSQPISGIPEEKSYKNVVTFLINKKKQGCKFIEHSISGLKHIYSWPRPKKITCLSSLIFSTIEPDGKMFICDMFPDCQKYSVSMNGNLREKVNNLKFLYSCNQCWNRTMVEFNLLRGIKMDVFFELWKGLWKS
jgi:MoaA/NifB/PqqE/SkfB family radical SAM enzyme